MLRHPLEYPDVLRSLVECHHAESESTLHEYKSERHLVHCKSMKHFHASTDVSVAFSRRDLTPDRHGLDDAAVSAKSASTTSNFGQVVIIHFLQN